MERDIPKGEPDPITPQTQGQTGEPEPINTQYDQSHLNTIIAEDLGITAEEVLARQHAQRRFVRRAGAYMGSLTLQ